MVTRAPAGAASSRSRRLEANTRIASCSAAVHSRIRKSTLRWTWILVRHAHRTVSISHLSPGRPRSVMPKRCMILQLVRTDGGRRRRSAAPARICRSRISSFSPRNIARMRCDGNLVQRLAEIEIVLELLALGLLALAHRGGQQAVRPHLLAQRADQVGVLGEALDQDGARAVERGGGIGHLLVGIDERRGQRLRIVLAAASATARPAAPAPPPWRSRPWCGASA